MATMSRHRPPHVAQGTWRSGALHVWGWNGIDTAPMAWLYGGFRMLGDDGRRTGWHDTPVSYGAIGRITISPRRHPRCMRHRSSSTRSARPCGCRTCRARHHLSDSLAWFARVAELARRTVSSGRILPAIVEEGPFTVARWRPVTDADDRRHAHRARRVDAADLHARVRAPMSPASTASSSTGSPARFLAPIRLEGRPRPAAHPVGPGAASNVRRTRQARPRGTRRHRRVRRRTAPAP